jgi:lanthanide-dependent methanol dehydrogenase
MWIKSSVVAIIAVFLPVAAHAQGASADDLMSLQADDGQWALPAKNYSATRFSTLNKITPENVKNLKVAWSMSTGTNQGHEGAPLVVGTTMYVHSSYPNHVYAVDLTKEGGTIMWKYTPKQDARAVPVACCDLVHRGLNYAKG